MIRVTLYIIVVLCFSLSFGQKNQLETDFSSLWLPGQISLTDGQKVTKLEPIGYFGDNYYRFRIHFISVIQNPTNKKQYLVYGKNKLKDNVSDFQGFIEIDSIVLYDSPNVTGFKEGMIYSKYSFYENPQKSGTGMFKGSCITFIHKANNNDEVEYNTVAFLADGFKNNQFEGHWINYRTGNIKKCNWGDYRIPDSDDLDIGAGEFHVKSEYLSSGWKNYEDAYHPFPSTEAQKQAKEKAMAIEKQEWWK